MKLTMKEMEKRYDELFNGETANPSDDFRDKCKGAIVGTVVGDALFRPIEFTDKFCHEWIEGMIDGGSWSLPAGYYTDDSSMMLCIMQGYLDALHGGEVVESIAKSFVKWWKEGLWSPTGRCFDIGSSCLSGLQEFEKTGSLVNGHTWSHGCGGIMRYAPSWMIDWKNGTRYEMSEAINNIDHHHIECIDAVRTLSDIYTEHIEYRKKTSVSSIYSNWWDAIGGFDAQGCLNAALFGFNKTNNFRDAVIASGNLGGDADSVAAVCGGMAGAYYGFKAIPEEWVNKLFEVNKLIDFTERFLDETVECKD